MCGMFGILEKFTEIIADWRLSHAGNINLALKCILIHSNISITWKYHKHENTEWNCWMIWIDDQFPLL